MQCLMQRSNGGIDHLLLLLLRLLLLLLCLRPRRLLLLVLQILQRGRPRRLRRRQTAAAARRLRLGCPPNMPVVGAGDDGSGLRAAAALHAVVAAKEAVISRST